jgi:hypothetical protein
MVLNPVDKIISERKKYFKRFCSDTVADWLIQDKTLTLEQKKELIRIARDIALKRGSIRVYWEDLCLALKNIKSFNQERSINGINAKSDD